MMFPNILSGNLRQHFSPLPATLHFNPPPTPYRSPPTQGVITNEAPALLRDLSKILESILGIDATAANSKLNLLELNGEAVDYQSLQLALAWMEQKG